MTKLIENLIRKFDEVAPPKVAYAHCDVPCGVYETDTIKHCAETCQKLVEKVTALEKPNAEDAAAVLNYKNTVIRMVDTKEKFAHRCKEELLILWTDYFKEEHLAKFPDLHTKFWKATKLCSTVKREVSLESTEALKKAVAEIAEIFAETKK